MAKLTWILCLLAITTLFTACDPNRIFDDNKIIADNKWYYKNAIPFDVQIKDTSKFYNVYVNLRVTSDYKYNNIFMWLNTTNTQKKN